MRNLWSASRRTSVRLTVTCVSQAATLLRDNKSSLRVCKRPSAIEMQRSQIVLNSRMVRRDPQQEIYHARYR
ncbi:hypothetical protein E2C01_023767 [Portunus trituberculatus]|uniref:Uncharacterized protein n=1 Tax=Portunus trituberculatus TaxID=210409 RepID=A0A5B7E8T6_PORTR|nr:hypothetical protein [Portunus trituberculatus]